MRADPWEEMALLRRFAAPSGIAILMEMEALVPGSLVADRYRLERVLGEGGMGTVFEATHLQLAQRVAIKFLLPELCSKPDSVTRFLCEARAAVKIESEHVARVMDVGTSAAGVPYMVMEYLQGSDLASTLETRGKLPVFEAVAYLLQAADAIAEAHALGIIHRDLKPSNLFLATRRDGSFLLKVLDFGISKAASELMTGGLSTRTATATVMGSPLYMSPEQVRSSKSVDPRADIWSLGVILHEFLAGEPPFIAETLPGVLASIVADPPIRLRSLRGDVPVALEEVILRCLEKDRTKRYGSVAELGLALSAFAPPESRSVLARISMFGAQRSSLPPRESISAAPAHAADAPVVSGDTQRAWARALGPVGERRLGLAVIFALALAAAGFAHIGLRGPTADAGPTMSHGQPQPLNSFSARLPSAASTTESALSMAHWEALEARLAGQKGAPQPVQMPAPDERLFSDRK